MKTTAARRVTAMVLLGLVLTICSGCMTAQPQHSVENHTDSELPVPRELVAAQNRVAEEAARKRDAAAAAIVRQREAAKEAARQRDVAALAAEQQKKATEEAVQSQNAAALATQKQKEIAEETLKKEKAKTTAFMRLEKITEEATKKEQRAAESLPAGGPEATRRTREAEAATQKRDEAAVELAGRREAAEAFQSWREVAKGASQQLMEDEADAAKRKEVVDNKAAYMKGVIEEATRRQKTADADAAEMQKEADDATQKQKNTDAEIGVTQTGLKQFLKGCGENLNDSAVARMAYEEGLAIELNTSASYVVDIDIRGSDEAPTTKPSEYTASFIDVPFRARCAIGARLVCVDHEKLDVDKSEWVMRRFDESGTVRWLWSVKGKRPGTHDLVLEIRPAVAVLTTPIEYVVPAGESDASPTTPFKSQVRVNASSLQKFYAWWDENWSKIVAIATAVGAATLGFIAWARKLWNMRQKEGGDSSAAAVTSHRPPGPTPPPPNSQGVDGPRAATDEH